LENHVYDDLNQEYENYKNYKQDHTSEDNSENDHVSEENKIKDMHYLARSLDPVEEDDKEEQSQRSVRESMMIITSLSATDKDHNEGNIIIISHFDIGI
jgi:hypothetical protein